MGIACVIKSLNKSSFAFNVLQHRIISYVVA